MKHERVVQCLLDECRFYHLLRPGGIIDQTLRAKALEVARMGKTIVIVGTLDSYGRNITFVRELIEQRGHRAIVVDVSTGSEPSTPADISCGEVAEAGGGNIEEIRASPKEQEIYWIMINGAIKKTKELYSAGNLDGIICVGGTTGAFIGTKIMKALPFGVPSLVVTSAGTVPGLTETFFGTKDITLMDSVLQISTVNDFVKSILTQAAGAICGMAESSAGAVLTTAREKPLVALTLLGNVYQCADYVIDQLEQRGYQVVPFHAQGVPDRLMEDMIEQGLFQAVIDLSPGGIVDGLIGGLRTPVPYRLEAAGKRGIPQVVTPSGLEFICPLPSQYKPEYDLRKKFQIDNVRVMVRTTAEELIPAARTIAAKLNKARGPVKFLVPLRGWSRRDGEGSPLDDPEADRVFVEELRKCLNPSRICSGRSERL